MAADGGLVLSPFATLRVNSVEGQPTANVKNMAKFNLVSDYKPQGDQPEAISQLSWGLKKGKKYQTLLGVTG
ncbi:MAG: hypothetical protein KAW52_05440, partial [candidate division Zixibacteria bacterium]|nr:hypothetical protein [candidate division Zixibacteria bacterium]